MTRPTFIHIPRTAGTSVSKALGYGARKAQHKPASIYHPKALERAWTIVRSPYSRAVSLCAFLLRDKLRKDDRLLTTEDFEAWLYGGQRDAYGREPVLYQETEYSIRVDAPQCDFLSDDVKQIWRFETLREAWPAICVWVDVQAQYPPLDPGLYQDWRALYTPALRGRVRERYARDFERFRYY